MRSYVLCQCCRWNILLAKIRVISWQHPFPIHRYDNKAWQCTLSRVVVPRKVLNLMKRWSNDFPDWACTDSQLHHVGISHVIISLIYDKELITCLCYFIVLKEHLYRLSTSVYILITHLILWSWLPYSFHHKYNQESFKTRLKTKWRNTRRLEDDDRTRSRRLKKKLYHLQQLYAHETIYFPTNWPMLIYFCFVTKIT